MKHILIALAFLVVSGSCTGQTIKVTYSETMDLSEKLESITDPMIKKMVMDKVGKPKLYKLVSSDGVSSYQIQDDEEEIAGGKVAVYEAGGENVFYKNHKNNELINQTNFMSRHFLIEEKLEKYDWKITNETAKIGDYSCKKAILKQADKEIAAWFTSEIPSNEGPKKYYGLPGLILKVQTKSLVIEATKIELLSKQAKIIKPTKGKKVTRAEFDKIKEKKIKNITGGNEKSGGVQIIKM